MRKVRYCNSRDTHKTDKYGKVNKVYKIRNKSKLQQCYHVLITLLHPGKDVHSCFMSIDIHYMSTHARNLGIKIRNMVLFRLMAPPVEQSQYLITKY